MGFLLKFEKKKFLTSAVSRSSHMQKTEAYLGPCQTSMMKLFAKIVNDF